MATDSDMSSWTDLLHSSTKLLEQAAPSAQFPPLQVLLSLPSFLILVSDALKMQETKLVKTIFKRITRSWYVLFWIYLNIRLIDEKT